METLRIDPNKIEELKELVDEDDPDFLIELLEDYIDNSEENLKAIRYAIQAKDTVTVVRTAHTLKGASSNIHFPQRKSSKPCCPKHCRKWMVLRSLGSISHVMNLLATF